jgi:kumamolisin
MSERKVFTGSVTELPAQSGLTSSGLMVAPAKPDTRNETMELFFSLEMPSREDLERRVVADEIVPSQELTQKYSPKRAALMRSKPGWHRKDLWPFGKVPTDPGCTPQLP